MVFPMFSPSSETLEERTVEHLFYHLTVWVQFQEQLSEIDGVLMFFTYGSTTIVYQPNWRILICSLNS